MRELLKELSLAFGPSGCEDEVRAIVKKYLKENMPKNSRLFEDNSGGVFLLANIN